MQFNIDKQQTHVQLDDTDKANLLYLKTLELSLQRCKNFISDLVGFSKVFKLAFDFRTFYQRNYM